MIVDCVAHRFVYKHPDSDWAVLLALQNDSEIRLVGPVGHAEIGEHMQADGVWEEDRRYGKSFKVKQFQTTRPQSLQGIMGYLAANMHGVGPGLAQRIVAHFGEETLQVIDNDPRRLMEVSGFGASKLDVALEEWNMRLAVRDVMLKLAQYGVTPALARRIYRAWGERTLSLLADNPYRLTDIERIGFITADEVALRMGLPLNDSRRMDAGVQFVLAEAQGKNGHTYLKLAELLEESRNRLRIEDSPEALAERIRALAESQKLVLEPSVYGERHVYLPVTWKQEARLAVKVRSLSEQAGLHPVPKSPPVEKFRPTLDQWKAVQTALGSRVSILTGGPGTGKSTICRVLCKTAAEIGLSVQLCAPTGKAAKRIAEVTNHQASTIHRMLEWQPFGGFARNSSNHLTCDVLVVDEASMIDLPLADALFQAVGDTTHVVLVGDIDQLPPVGIGRVLDDIIRSKRVPLTRLTEIFRQAKRSMIIQAAYAINGGRIPDDDPDRAQEKLEGDKIIQDYFWIPRNDNEEIAQLVVDYATERIPNRYGFDPLSEIQVLAPQKNTLVGVDALNRVLQEKLNPHGLEISERKHFRLGDKLLNTRNNYTHDVMNGEFGFIKSWREADEMVEIELESRIVEMGKSDVEENFVLAYATTVHKMQGSASKAIVLPLSMSYYAMLSRNLLYTAVTRSEELCMIIGQPRALAYSVHEGSSLKRNSALAERLQHPLLSGQLV